MPATSSALFAAPFDLVIVGGGITGAALAYSAVHARRPLRVALVEQGALASGTSSRSSGLLHGGLRYLAQGRFALVRRLLQGRRAFARLAPHLIQRAPFVLPCGGSSSRSCPQSFAHGRWPLQLGLSAYALAEASLFGDPLLVDGQPLRRPVYLDPRRARAQEPLLHDASRGAFAYDELSVDDAALVRALADGARRAGALVVTQVRCQRLHWQGDRVAGLWLRDGTGTLGLLRAAVVADATGAWGGALERSLWSGGARAAPPPHLRLSRGTHLVLPRHRLPLFHTVAFFAPDGRALFASPRGAEILVGTTEQEHRAGPEAVSPTAQDRQYLFTALRQAFPDAGLHPGDVCRAFAGVRPLASPGQQDLGQLDRGYRIEWPLPGLLALRGGKLTLALHGARQALSALHRRARWLGIAPPAPLPELSLPPLPAPALAGAPVSAGAWHPQPGLPADRQRHPCGQRQQPREAA